MILKEESSGAGFPWNFRNAMIAEAVLQWMIKGDFGIETIRICDIIIDIISY